MKFRLIALILTLALSLVGWAQETPAAPNSTPAPQAKSCCHNMADMKDGKSCCQHAGRCQGCHGLLRQRNERRQVMLQWQRHEGSDERM